MKENTVPEPIGTTQTATALSGWMEATGVEERVRSVIKEMNASNSLNQSAQYNTIVS